VFFLTYFFFFLRLTEFSTQTQIIPAIQRGIEAIIPTSLLALLTWHELELRICGSPGVDLNLLKKNTQYLNGLGPSSQLVKNFWYVLERFSPEEQEMFLIFVWGRSRLPPASEFTTKFQLEPLIILNDRDVDEYLPEARVCFFSLSLPMYSTKEKLREKLLYAITTCKEFLEAENVESELWSEYDE